MDTVSELHSNSLAQPLVSVGVPTYNRPHELKRALKCLMSQTHSNLEIIVSDNCSTEAGVEALVCEYLRNDSRIHFFRQDKNIGGIANFEFVMHKAIGKYFIWFADDDLCEVDFIEKLVGCMEANRELILCMCDVQSIDENDNPLEVNRLESIRLSGNWKDIRKLFFRYPTSNIFFSIYGLYKTSILQGGQVRQTTGWKGLIINAEVPYLAQVALRGRIASIPEILKKYRRHPDSWYVKESNKVSALDMFMLKWGIRWKLCKIALMNDSVTWSTKLTLFSSIVSSYLASLSIRGMIYTIVPAFIRRPLKHAAIKLLKLPCLFVGK